MRDGLYDTAHHQPEKKSHQENDEMRHDAPCAHANSVPRPEALRYHYRFTRRARKGVVESPPVELFHEKEHNHRGTEAQRHRGKYLTQSYKDTEIKEILR